MALLTLLLILLVALPFGIILGLSTVWGLRGQPTPPPWLLLVAPA